MRKVIYHSVPIFYNRSQSNDTLVDPKPSPQLYRYKVEHVQVQCVKYKIKIVFYDTKQYK